MECDLRDSTAVRRVLRDVRPDRIFHLAAQSYVPTSWMAPGETLSINVLGQVNLFEAMRDLDLPARVHIAGSSEEYGLVLPDEVPISEDNPLRPLSPYAVSKVTQDLLAYQYWRSYRLHVVRTRGFNHTGPRRGEVFVTSNFCPPGRRDREGAPRARGPRRQSGVDPRLHGRARHGAGVLAGPRARAAGEVYNICSGRGYSARQVLDILLDLAHVKVEVRQDPARMRPSDVTLLLGDCSKFRSATGWEPRSRSR